MLSSLYVDIGDGIVSDLGGESFFVVITSAVFAVTLSGKSVFPKWSPRRTGLVVPTQSSSWPKADKTHCHGLMHGELGLPH